MIYDQPLYRPPSEANSLIIQVTLGCSHNKCTFCNMYKSKKFRIRSKNDIFKDLEEMAKYSGQIDRIFLADGDALVLKTSDLKDILVKIKELFPSCKRVGIYATPRDILRKTAQELTELKEHGLVLFTELSPSDKILNDIKERFKEIIEQETYILQSQFVTLISGLGKGYWEEHAIESARVINEINPDYLGLLTAGRARNRAM